MIQYTIAYQFCFWNLLYSSNKRNLTKLFQQVYYLTNFIQAPNDHLEKPELFMDQHKFWVHLPCHASTKDGRTRKKRKRDFIVTQQRHFRTGYLACVVSPTTTPIFLNHHSTHSPATWPTTRIFWRMRNEVKLWSYRGMGVYIRVATPALHTVFLLNRILCIIKKITGRKHI